MRVFLLLYTCYFFIFIRVIFCIFRYHPGLVGSSNMKQSPVLDCARFIDASLTVILTVVLTGDIWQVYSGRLTHFNSLKLSFWQLSIVEVPSRF
jgi:hypothetical protein